MLRPEKAPQCWWFWRCRLELNQRHMLAHGELKRDSRHHFHPPDSQSRILGLSHTWCGEVLVLAALTGCEDQEDQERWEAAGRSATMFQVLRVQVEARLLPPHAPRGGVTCHPRSCLKNVSSPACQRWFPSDPHAGTSEHIPVGSTSADLRRDVCGAGEALPENFPWLPHLLFRRTWIHLNPVLAV